MDGIGDSQTENIANITTASISTSTSINSARLDPNTQQPARFAYVTLVTSDSYVDGALVLLHSLRRTLTSYSIVCLVTPLTLSESSLQRLHQHFDGVIETGVRQSTDDHGLALLGRPDLRSTLTKIQLWDPALFGAWDALCYLDADTLVRQSIDDLFSRFYTWRSDVIEWRQGGLISASPDTGWPDCFNSGVLLLAPGYECYQGLVSRATRSDASFDGADQGLLNEHFADWAAAKPYRRLPFLYNATANFHYTYKPALQRFGHDVRVVHFIGLSKPWHWERTPGGQLVSDPSTSERWRQLINMWWNIHDEHVSGWRHWRGLFDKNTAFGRGYHHVTEPVVPELSQPFGDHSGGINSSNNANTSAYQSTSEEYNMESNKQQQQPEVSDWDKDWSWATDRVHPLDYSYLATHTNLSSQSPNTHSRISRSANYDGPQTGITDSAHFVGNSLHQFGQDASAHTRSIYGNSHDDEHSDSSNNASAGHSGRYNDVHRDISNHDYSGGDNDANHSHYSSEPPGGFEYHHDNNQHYHHHNHHHHDQQQSDRQMAQEPPAWMRSQRPWEDVAREGWMHHEDYKPHEYDEAYVGRHIDQSHSTGPDLQSHSHYHHHQHQPEYTHIPLANNQPIYEATQVVLQPRDSGSGHDHDHMQGQKHDYNDHLGGRYLPYQDNTQHSSHNYGNHSYSSEQHATDYPHSQSQDQHQDQHQYHQHHQHSQHQYQPQMPGAYESKSTSASSPLYYPQPKSPMIVNPVALWESSEEQSRRRAWAQQLKGDTRDEVQETIGNRTLSQHEHHAPWSNSVPSADQRIPPSAMDHIDSSQLPRETPWKISHVRQRPSNNKTIPTNAQQDSHHTGMQFKEGVANDGSAREAAGQVLKRWNEAVIARNIKSRLGSLDYDQISHSNAIVEKGTDAIRLETTVSCEAENSNGERTVYRFTLSSTLDVGGAKQPTQKALQPQLAAAPAAAVLGLHQSPESHSDSIDIRGSDDYDYSDITDLRQPKGYQEPAISRRSSFVQLPPNSLRAPHMALQSGFDNTDQFTQADARYWKLQRQLIDLEMSQQHQENNAHPAASYGSGWHNDVTPDKLDLASPPTPTHKQMSAESGRPGHRIARRSSAFRIADPMSFAQQGSIVSVPDTTHGSTLSAETALQSSQNGSNTTTSRSQIATTGIGGLGRLRSTSSPRLTSEYNIHRDPSSPIMSTAGKPALAEAEQPPNENMIRQDYPSRSRSQSALRRIAAENSAQAAVASASKDDASQARAKAGDGTKSSVRPIFVTTPLDDSESEGDSGQGSSSESDNGIDDDDKHFKSAIGRHPTPFPRRPRDNSKKPEGSPNSVRENIHGNADSAQIKPATTSRSVPAPLKIDSSSQGFGPTRFDISPSSAETPLTPTKQKLRPRINWDDDDENHLPPENDRSIDAQWLRIIRGAPPPRLQTASQKGSPEKDSKQNKDAASTKKASKEMVMNDASPKDKDNTETTNIDAVEVESAAATLTTSKGPIDAADAIDDADTSNQDMQEALDDQPSKTKIQKPAQSSRAPPRKLHSTRSFLNLTSKVFDTLSDSETDPTEEELQKRFWARAMKPSKSGASTPYSPGRRKSVVEMSSAISPKDLEEWMRWQDDSIAHEMRDYSDKPADFISLGSAEQQKGIQQEPQEQQEKHQLITPPSSKNAATGSLYSLDDQFANTSAAISAASYVAQSGDQHHNIDSNDANNNENENDDQLEIRHLDYLPKSADVC
ncbi:glycogenin glucosyltransferase [Coemansia spiralis]|uniref:glycogenin glucosyltransferase n=2 Tax=Coemansia TaxID=4863 RepID=A0A9W8L0W7_9FUNG|nr:glycogenin glucosyltransferase [Coemansia umbellata]KAJ2621818.1 glycogenin glucosyltransferase [Coemansia sp. RSA 1358]KAJ2681205.1 glycogenin glucosyltransferase [Coemansia spiralis]